MVLGACSVPGIGSSSAPSTPPSALDPATQAPARSIFYASVVVQPQGSLKQDLVNVINQLGGPTASSELTAKLTTGLSAEMQNVWDQVQPWIGQRIGLALVGLPPAGDMNASSLLDYLVVIMPTSNPGAASSALASGVSGMPDLTSRVVGNFAYVGGAYGVQVASDLPASRALSASPVYQRLMSQLSDGQVATLYLRLHPFEGLELKAEAPTLPPSELEAVKQLVAKDPQGEEVMSLTVSDSSVGFEEAHTGPAAAGGATGNVASLPGSSWLALALGSSVSKVGGLMQTAFNESLATGTDPAAAGATLRFVDDDLLPALGPMSLAVSGETERTMKAGFEMTPSSQAAGENLLSAIEQMIGNRRLPLKLGEDGDKLVATFGYANFADLVSPRRTLAGDPLFRQALRQLPRHVPAEMFVNFAPINRLLTLDQSPKDAGLVRAVGQMRYLVMGGGAHQFRLVLKLK